MWLGQPIWNVNGVDSDPSKCTAWPATAGLGSTTMLAATAPAVDGMASMAAALTAATAVAGFLIVPSSLPFFEPSSHPERLRVPPRHLALDVAALVGAVGARHVGPA